MAELLRKLSRALGRSLPRAGSGPKAAGHGARQQVSTWTQANRYPIIFRAMRDQHYETADLRILSFGCSTGEEIQSLDAHYFTGAQIDGVDIDEAALIAARSKTYANNEVEIFDFDAFAGESKTYDLIFAMSVLCRWPTTKGLSDISGIYPFSAFAKTATLLHARLAPGGYLVIFNANYRFEDTEAFAMDCEVVPVVFEEEQFVHKFAPDGKRLVDQNAGVVFLRRRS